MESEQKLLSKAALIAIGVIAAVILVVGLSLLGLGYNYAFFNGNSTVQAIFEVITFTGESIFFIVLVAIFYIVYDKRFAKNLALSLLASTYINEVLKELFQDPRPPANVDPSEEHGFIEEGYGFPSGHSQNAVATWGYMAQEFKNRTSPNYIIPALLSGLIFLIAVSRIILGVHDLQDIIGGLLIGIGVLLGFIYLEPVVSEKFEPLDLNIKLILVVIASLVLFLVGTLLFPTAGMGLVEEAQPYSDAGGFAQVGGVILGLGIGYLLENEKIGYDPHELDVKWKIMNVILGLVILFAIYYGMEAFKDVFNSVAYRYVRYALVAFILSFLCPLLFKKINPS